MFGTAFYARSRIFNNRYRVTGMAAGFYRLQGVDDNGNFNNTKRTVPIFCSRLFYRSDP